MRKLLLRAAALLAFTALATGASVLWMHRPWRTAVRVNGRILTAGELSLRAQTLLNDARRVKNPAITQQGREEDLLAHFKRQAAKMWIVKEVLLSEAVTRGFTVSAADEQDALEKASARLASRNLTPEQFFKEGPLPEAIKRRDFREGMLVDKFTMQEVRDKISVTPNEIDARLTELRKANRGKDAPPPSRKLALDSLHNERFRSGFRNLFRELFAKTDVKSPAFPALESADAVSPAHPETQTQTINQQ